MASVSWIGQTLNNRYRIEELLGQGGMSSVYKASDPNLRRTVAVKMIHPHLSGNPDFLRRFEEEAAAVAQLRHENIIQVYDFNHDGDSYYMVMEYVPGETLETRLKRLNEKNQRMAMTDAAHLMEGVCNAVAYAHSRGIIHRDIKPANIILDVLGNAFLMDFGIARIVGGQIHTAAGAVLGTALYMSPEQIRGERVDERADIYSLGVTLFEAVSGKPPFEADSAMTLMMMHLNDPLPDIHQLRPAVPESLVQVIARALEKKREDRYQTAGEMAAALRLVAAQLSNAAAQPAVSPKPAIEQTQVELPVERTFLDQRPTQEPDSEVHKPEPYSVPQLGQTPTGPARPVEQPAVSQSAATGQNLSPQFASAQPGYPGSQPAQSQPRKSGHTIWFILGGLVLLAVLCLAGVAVATNLLVKKAASSLPGIVGGLVPTDVQPLLTQVQPLVTDPASAENTMVAMATQFSTLVPTDVLGQAQSTLLAAGSALMTATPAPVENATVPADTPVPAGAATVPAGQLAVRINSITIENGRYVVNYETFGYTEKLGDLHVHFFFNTVPPDQAGMPGKGPWVLYGGPRPFKGYMVANRPAGATQICALVANPDHTVQANSGNCMNIPGQ